GATIFRSVIDSRQHDQRRRWIQADGQGQQHRHGGEGADARQRAEQGAQEHTHKAVEQVCSGECCSKPDCDVVENIHQKGLLSTGMGSPNNTTKQSQIRIATTAPKTTAGTMRDFGEAGVARRTEKKAAGKSPMRGRRNAKAAIEATMGKTMRHRKPSSAPLRPSDVRTIAAPSAIPIR